ncbi:MAG: hypothetical protein QOG68_551 [Solirubrobacteraceae bacterium]|nr:hypothetical protein [Solirubrobacteraceae bacterium]
MLPIAGPTSRVRAAMLLMLAVAGAAATAAQADGPGVGAPTVVSVGDSYISGEAARWAGNASSESYVDAGGATAYYDNAANNGETIPGCHRSKANETKIGGGVVGKDLACSGATTATQPYNSNSDFKPGLDFYDDGAGHQGQAKLLQSYATTHNVKLVAVSIGGNDFNFAGIVTDCVEDFLYSPSWYPDYCYDDSVVTSQMASSNVTAKTTAIKNAILRVNTAMANAGYTSSQFTIVVQDYPSPIPSASGFRYSQSGYTRQSTGGCGFWDADANYANATLLPTIDNAVMNAATQTGLANVKKLEIRSAFNGRRLCENTVDRVDHTAYSSWSAPGAVDHIEWFQGIRTVTTSGSNYYIQESLHPDYLAQLALRSCVRQSYNAGTPKGGTCSSSANGVNAAGEPNMALQ